MPRPTLAAGGAPVSARPSAAVVVVLPIPISPTTRQSTPPSASSRGEAGTGAQRGIHLCRGEGRPREHVGGPVGDLGVAHTGRGGAGQADVGDQHVVPAVRASTPTALSPRAAAAATCALTSGANRLVPWMVWPWSAAQISTPARRLRRRRRPGDRGPALDERLERAEAPAGLDELVEAVASGDRCRRGPATAPPPRAAWRRSPFVAPALLHHDVRRAATRDDQPAASRPGRTRALVGPAHAEVGDRIDAVGDAEQRAEVAGPIEAHPADAEPFGARGQPQVLDRARRRVDVGLGDRAAPEDLAVGVAVVAADDDAERGLDDALDLLVEELAGALVEAVGLAQALALGQPADLDARRRVAHARSAATAA